MHKYRQITPEVWGTVRALYESGKFRSAKMLQLHCKTLFGDGCPSLSSIEKQIHQEKWHKYGNVEIIAETKKRNFVELFAEIGLDERRRAEIMAAGACAAEMIRTRLERQLGTDAPVETSDIMAYHGALNAARHYVDMINKICGTYAIEQKQINVSDASGSKNLKPVDLLTDDELQAEYNRLCCNT